MHLHWDPQNQQHQHFPFTRALEDGKTCFVKVLLLMMMGMLGGGEEGKREVELTRERAEAGKGVRKAERGRVKGEGRRELGMGVEGGGTGRRTI